MGGNICSQLGYSLNANRDSDPAILDFITDMGIFQLKNVP